MVCRWPWKNHERSLYEDVCEVKIQGCCYHEDKKREEDNAQSGCPDPDLIYVCDIDGYGFISDSDHTVDPTVISKFNLSEFTYCMSVL